MNMRHMEGKSQLAHLRCCKIPKNIGSCSLSDMGLSEPVSILRRGRRKTRLQASMGLQLRNIQVLCLVLVVVAEPFLRYAAAAGGVVPRTRMATPAADDDSLVLLANCFPSVILIGSGIPYTCEVGYAQTLNASKLFASYYSSDGLNSGWPATLAEGTKKITFVSDHGGPPSGRWDLVITRPSGDEDFDVPLTTNKSMDFMRIGATRANFATLYPYYG
ncbi:hypothetical protein DQ04_21501000, partial [Trypanosoma grayi]|uniref:hypothetical protein n=1 Tax=Trypanosoma grayi TaxID=71804 RepID=UPI0004F43FFA